MLFGQADRFVVSDQAARRRLEVTLDAPHDLILQDQRGWQDPRYVVCFAFHQGDLKRGQTAGLTATFALTGTPDTTPVTVTLKPDQPLGAFVGAGGNFCVNRATPVTALNLQTLRLGWARVGISLAEWEPRNDNADPAHTDRAALAANDRPGTELRLDFDLLRELGRRGVPCCVSVWHLPEWLYADPGDGAQNWNRMQRRVGNWDELIECVASYLDYAKRKYGVAPELFSFNEPDIGVNVLFSAAEHRDLIIRLGARLAQLGLKTKLVLGDVAGAGAVDYVRPAAADPEARKYLGAVAFHSWHGRVEDFARWPGVARELGLPLLVTELGVDAGAWHTPWVFSQYGYALDDLRMYQLVLQAARPQAVLYWELTDDYPLAQLREGRATLTPRYWFTKHFCNLTPAPGEQFTAESSNPSVIATAFRGLGRAPAHAIHVANFGAARRLTITGLPPTLRELWSVATGKDFSFRPGGLLPVQAGSVQLELPAQSLLTLTSRRP